MKLIVIPLNGLSEVPFGSPRELVHLTFGNPPDVFRLNQFAENTTDNYQQFHVYYHADDTVEAINIFPDDSMDIEVFGVLLPKDYAELCSWLKENDTFAVFDSEGMFSVNLGICLNAPDGEVESILFAESGYLDAYL